jgi:thiol-disulfide isomerase/thioredoxin
MNLRTVLLISCLFFYVLGKSQQVGTVYKIKPLRERINKSDSTLVINFWATWCKPCVQELPAFDSLAKANPKVKILLVSLDFKEDIEKKVNPFLKKKGITSECVLLDEINGNDFVNAISPKWSGAIPATLLKNGALENLAEKKMKLEELQRLLNDIQK